jgi:hypothetical protein
LGEIVPASGRVSAVEGQGKTRARRVEPSSEVVGQRLEDAVVVVHLQTNRIHELNRTSARFWDLLQDESDVEKIERQMLEEFDVSKEELQAEIDELIGQLEAERLVTVVAVG